MITEYDFLAFEICHHFNLSKMQVTEKKKKKKKKQGSYEDGATSKLSVSTGKALTLLKQSL